MGLLDRKNLATVNGGGSYYKGFKDVHYYKSQDHTNIISV